jgi:hypothetical protein
LIRHEVFPPLRRLTISIIIEHSGPAGRRATIPPNGRFGEDLYSNNRIPLEDIRPRHFGWSVDGRVATVTIDRPERRRPHQNTATVGSGK